MAQDNYTRCPFCNEITTDESELLLKDEFTPTYILFECKKGHLLGGRFKW